MRATNRLSSQFVKTAPVGKHCDGAGLWLVKRDDGGAQWVQRVTVHGRRREMGLGGYPALGLANARKRRCFKTIPVKDSLRESKRLHRAA